MTLDAVLWDLDGTLIDSEPAWMAAEHRLAADFGVPWTDEDVLAMVGIDLWDGARRFVARGVDLEEEAIVARLTHEVLSDLADHMPFRPGAKALLAELKRAGIPTALVTMSTRSVVDAVVPALQNDLGVPPFEATIAGDEVARGKPHPDPYLDALTALGARATRSVAIEDSFPGSSSALAAGLATIGVPHAVDISGVPGIIHWPTLEGRSVSDLTAIIATRA